MQQPVEFIYGIPKLTGELVAKARSLELAVMISANVLSTWKDCPPVNRPDLSAERIAIIEERCKYKDWMGFSLRNLANLDGIPAHLDSAGFVAMVKYGGYLWAVRQYMALCAAHPWVRFSSMDLCVEKKVAPNHDAVMDRIAGTVNLNNDCRLHAKDMGINDRFMPVIQGFAAEDYYRCIDQMPWIDEYSVIGIGSMCNRKSVTEILHIVAMLDRYLPASIRLHLFGLKSDAAEAVRGLGHRIASVDSQSYGTAARQEAIKIRKKNGEFDTDDQHQHDLFGNAGNAPKAKFSKTDAFVAGIMESYVADQTRRLTKGGFTFQDTLLLPPPEAAAPSTKWERAIAHAQERYRFLVAHLQLDHNDAGNHLWIQEEAADLMELDEREWPRTDDHEGNDLEALAANAFEGHAIAA